MPDPMTYTRDVPDGDPDALAAERAHVVAHLSAVADADDDPDTHADDVDVTVDPHPDTPGMLRITGRLDAAPVADYLTPGYNPFAGVPAELRKVANDGQA